MREVCCMLFSPSQYDCRALRLSEQLRPPQKNFGIISKSHTPREEDQGALPYGMSLQFPVRTGYVAFTAHWVVSLIIVFNNSTWIMRHMLVLFDCANTRNCTGFPSTANRGVAACRNLVQNLHISQRVCAIRTYDPRRRGHVNGGAHRLGSAPRTGPHRGRSCAYVPLGLREEAHATGYCLLPLFIRRRVPGRRWQSLRTGATHPTPD
jgi:hypothetical protein